MIDYLRMMYYNEAEVIGMRPVRARSHGKYPHTKPVGIGGQIRRNRPLTTDLRR